MEGRLVAYSGYDLELGTSSWNAGVSDGNMYTTSNFGSENDFLGDWVYLVAVVDRATARFRTYANGMETNSRSISSFGSLDSSQELRVGDRNQVFRGLLDEVRVYAVALDPAWIAAEYANIAARAQFIAIGPREDRNSP